MCARRAGRAKNATCVGLPSRARRDVLCSLDFRVDVNEIRQGVFHTGVVTRTCGLASTLSQDAFKQERPLVREPGFLLKKTAEELANMAYSPMILEAAVGMAAINSLMDFKEEDCIAVNATEILAEKGKGKKVAIIGRFPFIPNLKAKVGNLWVIEKNCREDDLAEEYADSIVPQADVVGITGTSFTNHTLDHLLDLCRPEAFVLLLGDTTPLSPILFEHGIDALCGIKVIDPGLALNCVSQGANFRQIKGLRLLTMFK